MPTPRSASRRFFLLSTSRAQTPGQGQRRLIAWLWNLGTLTVLGATMAGLLWTVTDRCAIIPAVPTPTTTVQRGPLEITVSEMGETISPIAVEVRCDVPALRPLVPEGAQVTKGQPIGQYDVPTLERLCAEQQAKVRAASTAVRTAREELEAQQSKAESELAKAQLALDLAVMDREKYFEGDYKLDVEERQRAIALATRELEDTQERLGHYRNFVKKGFGTREQLKLKELDVTRAQYALWREQGRLMILEKYMHKRQQAELAARLAQAKRDLHRTQAAAATAVAKAREDLATAEANVQQLTGQLQRWQAKLAQPAVMAPAAGMVVYPAEKLAAPGNSVTFCKVIDPAQWQVSVKLPARRANKLRPGQKAKIQLRHTAGLLTGTVRAIAPDAPAQGEPSCTTTVAIESPPPDVPLKAGIPAEVEVVVDRLPNVLTLPREAVVARQDQHFALVVGVQGMELRPVAIGRQNGRQLEIRAGLEPGEQVVLDVKERLAGELEP